MPCAPSPSSSSPPTITAAAAPWKPARARARGHVRSHKDGWTPKSATHALTHCRTVRELLPFVCFSKDCLIFLQEWRASFEAGCVNRRACAAAGQRRAERPGVLAILRGTPGLYSCGSDII